VNPPRRTPQGFPEEFRRVGPVRDAGVEPAAFGFGGEGGSSPSVTSPSQAVGTIAGAGTAAVQPVHPFAGVRKPFAAPLLQAPTPARLRARPGEAERLLTVREVAHRLSISAATVYRLCERGELPHVRVSNALRVRLADLEAFLTGLDPE
jgi:excisionase family DNA binding protein